MISFQNRLVKNSPVKYGKEHGNMSYSICRIAKIKASGVTGIQIHDKREKDGISHTNEDINWTKSSENIDLLQQKENFRTVVSNRISELDLKRRPRSDATIMCQCLITSDNTFFKNMSRHEQNDFFKQSLDFIKAKYGERNLVSATIHYDERTPHMHVNFVPVTEDGRLSAKDLFSPNSLRMLQNDYNRFIRENGYDLQRGEIDSKRKHLDVEEYKIETRYKELEDTKKEVDYLESINKSGILKAEKGKIAYSTKDVDAIKNQNKSLKISNIKKDSEIKELKGNVKTTLKKLVEAQGMLQDIQVPLMRLKDLESENKALQKMCELNPTIDKAMKKFNLMKEQSYVFGNKMLKCKELYHDSLAERESLINRTSSCVKMAKDCDKKAADVAKLQQDISFSVEKENAIRSELEGLRSMFKKKAREDCQKRLEKQENETCNLVDKLQKNYNTTPENIQQRIKDYLNQKNKFIEEKATVMEQTDKIEQTMRQTVYSYKYTKTLSDCQQVDLKEISDRINNKVPLRYGEEKMFRLTQDDRQKILKDFEGKVSPKTIEKCKENFEKQDLHEREQRKSYQKEKNQNNLMR